MTKRKDPADWGKPGRPRKTTGVHKSIQPPTPELVALKTAVLKRSREAVLARKAAVGAALAQDELKYLERDQQLAWLCDVVVHGLPTTKVVPIMGGYDLVDMQERGASLAAMRLLMTATGTLPTAGVKVGVAIGGSNEKGEHTPAFIFVDYSNGRGPAE